MTPLLETAIQERDDARLLARAMWSFLQDGDFLGEVPCAEPGIPEWELWIKKHVVMSLVYDNPWAKEELP